VDNLPDGIVFINDNTAMVGFVSAANNLSSSTIAGAGLNLGAVVTQPTLVLVDDAVSTASGSNNDNYDSGTDVRFKLGDLVNNNTNDAQLEYVVIEFNALVLNITGNQSGTTRGNVFSSRINGNTAIGGNSNTVNVIIAEPNLTVGKTASTTGPVDAGDTFSYTITVTNNASGNNAAPAFDVRVSDILDAITAANPTVELELVAPPTGTLGAYTANDVATTLPGYTTVLANSSNNDGIDLTFNRLNAGDSITLVITVRVVNGALSGAEIENDVDVFYTSLPGASGTENGTIASTYGTADVDLNPGTDSVLANADANNGSINLGASAGERSGADVPNPTNNSAPADNAIRNNYAVGASAPLNLTIILPAIDKSFQDGSISADDTNVASSSLANVVIGEQIIYDIVVTLPDGVTQDVRVEDLVPAGLRVDSFSVITDGSASLVPVVFDGTLGTLPASSAQNGPGTLTIDFNDITVNVGASVANANRFVIRVLATVTNILANQESITRTNTARLVFLDPDGAGNAGPAADRTITDSNTGNDPTVTVVEPTLTIVKNVSGTVADAGDTLTYTITITNSSGQAAYDVLVRDIFDSALNTLTLTSVVSSGFSGGTFIAPTLGEFEFVANELRVLPAFSLDMNSGSQIVLTVTAVLSNSVTTGQQIPNSADVFWTSTNGANPDERTGADDPTPDSAVPDPALLNNYAVDSTVVTTAVANPVVSQSIVDTSHAGTTNNDATIGEVVTYRITVTLP